MQVRSSEGKRLGKLIEMYHGESQVYLRVVSAYERWKPWGRVGGGLYFPASAIAQVHDKRVFLNMDTKTAKGCTGPPGWIAANTRNYGPFIDSGGGTRLWLDVLESALEVALSWLRLGRGG